MKQWLKGVSAILTWIVLNHAASAQPCCGPGFANWYFGAHAGLASYRSQTSDRFGLFYPGTPEETNTSWAAGIQIGHDWFCHQKLFGLVVDWDWSDAKTKVAYFPDSPGINNHIESRLRWFSTFRARAGLALNDVLFYVTGGGTVADLRTDIRNSILDAHRNFQKHRWGWTVGFGSEFALCGNWTLNADVLYLRFRSARTTVTSDGRDFAFKLFDDAWTARLGLNYRFSLCSL